MTAVCQPSWYAQFAALEASGAASTFFSVAGCNLTQTPWSSTHSGTPNAGTCNGHAWSAIQCDQETMRANVEQQLQAYMPGASLSLDAYTVARNIASEISPHATVTERVALGEAAVNVGLGMLTFYNVNVGGPWYSNQCGNNPTASTAQPPSLLDLAIAMQIVDGGGTGNFAGGANQYFSAQSGGGLSWALSEYQSWAQGGQKWVGRLPGISTYDQMFFIPGSPSDSDWATQYQAGLDELNATASGGPTDPTFVDPASLPVCDDDEDNADATDTGLGLGTLLLIGAGLATAAMVGWGLWKRRKKSGRRSGSLVPA